MTFCTELVPGVDTRGSDPEVSSKIVVSDNSKTKYIYENIFINIYFYLKILILDCLFLTKEQRTKQTIHFNLSKNLFYKIFNKRNDKILSFHIFSSKKYICVHIYLFFCISDKDLIF